MFYYVDYKKAFNNDKEYWVQVAMRMNLQDALEKLNVLITKGFDVRMIVCDEDRHYTMEKC